MIKQSSILIVILLLLCPMSVRGQDRQKLNVLVIFTDDLGINDLSCYGRAEQPTPHLDRLAAEGARFTSAYCAQPICSPSRAALMTGLHPARLHMTTYLPGRPDAPSQMLLHPTIKGHLPADVPTIGERFAAAGYATGLVGKWHLGNGEGHHPTDRGFSFYHPGAADTEPSSTEGGKGEFDLTAAAIEFLGKNKDEPFLLIVSHNSPHIPLAARADLVRKHKDAFNPVYAAVIETLDASVGRLLAKLDDLKLADNTLVLFTSDNGGLHVHEGEHTPATHNTPFRAGKGFLYEGGLRVPAIARLPGRIKPGTTIGAPMVNYDWAPTFLTLAGIEFPKDAFDGMDVAALLTSDSAPEERRIFWHFPHYTNQGSRPAGAVREGAWKLIEHYEDGSAELFNLEDDPSEKTDLKMKEPAHTADLRGKLAAWRREIGAQENAVNPDFRPGLWKLLYVDIDVSTLTPARTAAEMHAKLNDWRNLMNRVPGRWGDAPDRPLPNVPEGKHVGLIVLHAKNAQVQGTKLRYEPEPHKDTLGYWTEVQDTASWTFDAPHAGTYDVSILQGAGQGSGGAEVALILDDQPPLTFTVEDTGHFQNFISRKIGVMELAAGAHKLVVKPRTRPGAAVMDLRRVTFTAAQP